MRRKSGVKMLLVATVVFCALFASGCGDRQYWPIAEGNFWTYAVRAREGVVIGETTFTVKSVKTEGQVRRAMILTTNEKGVKLSETGILVTQQGIYENSRISLYPTDYGVLRRTREVEAGSSPPYILSGKPRVGQEWAFNCRIMEKDANINTEVRGGGSVEKKEKVSVLAGAFKTYRVKWYIVDTSGNFSEERTYWFKRGIGPVKMEVSTAAGRMVLNLKKAVVGGKHIGE